MVEEAPNMLLPRISQAVLNVYYWCAISSQVANKLLEEPKKALTRLLLLMNEIILGLSLFNCHKSSPLRSCL